MAVRAQEAYNARDWSGVIDVSTPLLDTPDSGDGLVHQVLELRCHALGHLDRGAECFALLDERLGWPDAASWVPGLALARRWAAGAEARGQRSQLVAVVERLRAAHPGNSEVALLAYSTLRRFEGLDSLAPRALGWAEALDPVGALQLRLTVAVDQIKGRDYTAAIRTLGEDAPEGAQEGVDLWWDLRIRASTQLGDAAGARRLADRWGANPTDRPTAEASLAVSLSLASVLPVEGGGWIPALAAAAENVEEVRGDLLRSALLRRLVAHCAVEGRFDTARHWHDRATALGIEDVGDPDELQRLAALDAAVAEKGAVGGMLEFRLTGEVPAGASLWVSPDRDSRVDGTWTELKLGASPLSIERVPSATPARWVLRSDMATYASGTTWPTAGARTEVPVTLGEAKPRAVASDLRPRSPGDGVRRILVVILDSGDWRLTSYLRQRGEMPVLHALLSQGFRAPLVQSPAYTAAAMAALTAPSAQSSASFPAVLHGLGMELAGLASVGRNPFSSLDFFLPKNSDIFTTLGSGERRIANLLFSHGAVKAGRNAELVGPRGLRSTVSIGPLSRQLNEEELTRHPEWRGDGLEVSGGADHVTATAAQVDGVEELVRAGGAEIVLYRLEALDLATHGTYAAASAGGQDDGNGTLFSFYRYIDHRLGHLARAIDDDDVLIVMSDHGTLTSMQHDPVAMFVAWGNGVPRGIGQGLIRLGSVARLLATMEGVEVDWPGEDFAPWARAWREGRTPPGLGVQWAGEPAGG